MDKYEIVKQITAVLHIALILLSAFCMRTILKNSFISKTPDQNSSLFSLDKTDRWTFIFCFIYFLINLLFIIYFYQGISILYYKIIFPTASMILMILLLAKDKG